MKFSNLFFSPDQQLVQPVSAVEAALPQPDPHGQEAVVEKLKGLRVIISRMMYSEESTLFTLASRNASI